MGMIGPFNTQCGTTKPIHVSLCYTVIHAYNHTSINVPGVLEYNNTAITLACCSVYIYS